jgi:hypothetical protein
MGYSISKSLLESYNRSWTMYENAIREIPDEHWRTGEHHNLVPVVILLHSIEAADFYSADSADFEWGHRFNLRWSKDNPKDFPSRNELMVYLNEVREKNRLWVESFSDEEFLEEDPFPYNTGHGRLGRALYLLSHLRQHMGELNAELRQRELPRVNWR